MKTKTARSTRLKCPVPPADLVRGLRAGQAVEVLLNQITWFQRKASVLLVGSIRANLEETYLVVRHLEALKLELAEQERRVVALN